MELKRSLAVAPATSVESFFEAPRQYLEDVVLSLDDHAKAALGLVFINRNRLEGRVAPSSVDEDLMGAARAVSGCHKGTRNLRGSLLRLSNDDGQPVWRFAHPTMIDAFAAVLTTPELLPHLAAGLPMDVLTEQTSCGQVGIANAIVLHRPHIQLSLLALGNPSKAGPGTVGFYRGDGSNTWRISRLSFDRRRVRRRVRGKIRVAHADPPEGRPAPALTATCSIAFRRTSLPSAA